MAQKTKLELTWIGKEIRPRLEPRILLEDSEKSYHAPEKVTDRDIYDNRLIFGDNLLALKALEQEFTGKVKCIYIDPPYNTGAAFEHYDDGVEHSVWLRLMRDRLDHLWALLRPDNGVLLISVNDDEAHYLKVLCDELFGREKFVAALIWNYEGNTDNQAKIIRYHEYILVYSTTGEIDDPEVIAPDVSAKSKIHNTEIRNTIVKNGRKNPVKAVVLPRGFPAGFSSGVIRRASVRFPRYSEDLVIRDSRLQNELIAESGWSSREILESFIASSFSAVRDSKGQETIFELTESGAIEAIKVRVQTKGHFVSVLRGLGTTNQMRIMLEKMGIAFTYPKPVNLIAYLIKAFSREEDYILDSFAGSGTTGHSVMHLNRTEGSRRKFILIEQNPETMADVTIPRLRAVISGHETAEIPAHGGGFRYYRLAPSLIEKDRFGQPVISRQYNAAMLAEAMCKLMGYQYAPNDQVFWQHGRATENDYLYVTTQTLSHEQLAQLSEEVGEGRSLLVCCCAFRGKPSMFPNLNPQRRSEPLRMGT